MANSSSAVVDSEFEELGLPEDDDTGAETERDSVRKLLVFFEISMLFH